MDIEETLAIGNVPFATFKTNYKVGYGIGAALGAVMQCWRFEIEGYYRKNEGKQFLVAVASPPESAVLSIPFYYRSFSIMANAYYNFCLCSYLNLYLGIGIGPSWVRFQATPAPNRILIDAVRFSYQGMAGLTCSLPCNLFLSVGYRAWSALKKSGVPSNVDLHSIRYSEGKDPIAQSLEANLRLTF